MFHAFGLKPVVGKRRLAAELSCILGIGAVDGWRSGPTNAGKQRRERGAEALSSRAQSTGDLVSGRFVSVFIQFRFRSGGRRVPCATPLICSSIYRQA